MSYHAAGDGCYQSTTGSGETLANGHSVVQSSVETSVGRESTAGGGSSNDSVDRIKEEEVDTGLMGVDTLKEEASMNNVNTCAHPSSGTSDVEEISISGGVKAQPSYSGVQGMSKSRKMQVSRCTSTGVGGASKLMAKDSNCASDLNFASCDVMSNGRTTERDSHSRITSQGASRTVPQPALGRSPQGPTSAVGVVAREAWSSGTAAGRKKVGVGKVSGKSPDYSHVKSRISTRRSIKTEEVHEEKEGLKKVCTYVVEPLGIS